MSACLRLLGVSSPYSAPQQLSMSAAMVDLGGLVLCKAAALLVVEHGSGATFHLSQPDRRRQVLTGRACVICIVLYHIALFLCVWCFYSGSDTCLCVCVWYMVVVEGASVTFLSHHTTLCVFPMCVSASLEKGISGTMYSLAHPGAAGVHLTLSMYEAVCLICKCQ